MSGNTAVKRRFAAALVALAVLGAAVLIIMPWIKTFYDPALRERFTSFVDSLGIWGYSVMLGVQILQVIVAVIPGEPVELMAGALYGGAGGLIVCLIGSLAASAAIFLFMRKVGQRFLSKIFPMEKLEKFSFIHDSRKLETVTFILFLVPGTPKDMLTYVAGTTPIPMARFLIISTFARIPSVVSSTYIGYSVLAGNWYAATAVTLITLVVGLVGIFCRERILAFCRRHSHHGRPRA